MSVPEVEYCMGAHGVSLAYYRLGNGAPLILSPNIWFHLTSGWLGELSEATQRLASLGFEIVRYDLRSTGLSAGGPIDFSLDAQVEDIRRLADHLGHETFALCGLAFAALAAVEFSIRYPERLTHLILIAPVVDGDRMYQAFPTLQGLESLRAMGDEQWELYTFTHAAAIVASSPSSRKEREGTELKTLARVMRDAMTPSVLRDYLVALRTQEVVSRLASVKTPTLVLQRESAPAMVGFTREAAAGIPGAKLVPVPFNFGSYPSLAEVAPIARFVLGVSPPQDTPTRLPAPGGGTAVVLFIDIVDSTGLTERIGDAAFRAASRKLDASLRAIIADVGGTTIDAKTLGDGVLATFPAASQAIDAAMRCSGAGGAVGLPLHIGLHAGDVIREDNNVFGGVVNIAARISALSSSGEVLVSRTVADLARTSAGVVFEDRGEYALKGITDAQRLFAVRAR